jgi:hypothetical protein
LGNATDGGRKGEEKRKLKEKLSSVDAAFIVQQRSANKHNTWIDRVTKNQRCEEVWKKVQEQQRYLYCESLAYVGDGKQGGGRTHHGWPQNLYE